MKTWADVAHEYGFSIFMLCLAIVLVSSSVAKAAIEAAVRVTLSECAPVEAP